MANRIDIPDGWEVKKLGEVAEIHDGIHTTPVYTESGIKFISVEDIENYTNTTKYISETDFEKKFKYKPKLNDIFLTRIGSIGIPAFVTTNEDIAYYVTICLIHDISSKIESKYLYYYFQGNQFQKELHRRTLHVAFPIKINLGEIGLCTVLLPPLAEQEKIAEILSLWDKAIEQTKELIAYKEKQKKGLMQKYIYPIKNKVPYKIGELFNLSRGRVISKQEIVENSGIYPVYSSQTSNNGILGFINTYDYDDELITWTTDGANAGKVFARKGKFNCTNVCGIAIPKNRDLCNLLYVTSFLNNITKKYVSYVGNPKLMNNVFEEIEIFLPPLDEQKAIADILCKADEEIELLNKQLDLYTEQKKGLMQNLLTGKVRVKV